MSLRSGLYFIVATLCAALAQFASVRAAEQCTEAWQHLEANAHYSLGEDSRVRAEGNALHFDDGKLLVEPVGPLAVDMPLCAIEPKRHALVFVRSRAGCEHVFVLLGSSSVAIGDHRISLNAGDEAIITDHDPSYKDLTGEDEVGRRRVRMVKLADHMVCTTAEFSLLHLIERESLPYRVVHSTDSRDHALKERVIKMAAVLNMVTSRHGQYVTGAR